MQNMWQRLTRREKNQQGAIVIEATISLTIFMFVMFTFFFVIQIAYTQAKVALALDSTAKEISQYVHVYYAAGMDKKFTGTGGTSSQYTTEAGKVVQGVGEFFGMLAEISNSTGVGTTLGVTDILATIEQVYTDGGSALKGDSLTDLSKNLAAKALVTKMMDSHLKGWPEDTAEAFMKRHHITELKTGDTKFLEEGKRDVFLSVQYKIEVVKLLNLSYTFNMQHCAYTQAWGGGGQ